MSYQAHEYQNITQYKFDNNIKNDARDGGYTIYNGDNSGTLEIRANFFNIYVATLEYKFNPSNRTLYYGLTNKSPLVQENQIWDGILRTVSSCGGVWSKRLR